jgi:protoporphyrin/coproporphyrin ferrochelatase
MKGVLLMTYGTPGSLDEVEAYYTHIRGGQKPTEAEVSNLVERYKAIGGISPLIRITESQRDGLQRRLAREGSQTRVYCGMKHSRPFIDEVVKRAAEDGVDQLLSIALAPHFSKMSTGAYQLAVEMANQSIGSRLRLDFVPSWHTNPILIRAWADRIVEAKALPPEYSLVFSAHSLPEKILSQGDPYRSQLIETSELVAGALDRDEWSFAFQSAGHTRERWLGPDIIEHLRALAEGGHDSFVIAPIGFVADHLEILYDLDVECRAWAKEAGVRLERCNSLNDSKEFIDCLRSIVTEKGFA